MATTHHYNGIPVDPHWPPQRKHVAMSPMPVPYLEQSPTQPIRIDLGRQLFVDDYLIASNTMKRSWHQASIHPASPVVVPDQPWETLGEWKDKRARHAMPFSDGVWFDPADDKFKMWYMGGMLHATGYAESADGIHWHKPKLDVVDGTNITQPGNRDANVVWLDHEAKPHCRFKMFRFQKIPKRGLVIHESADGIHWSEPIAWAGPCADRSTVFYNPFRGTWVFSIKGFETLDGTPQRVRRYWETSNLRGDYWKDDKELDYWVGADDRFPRHADFDRPPQIYNLDAAPYESLMLGQFTVLHGPPDEQTNRQKINQIALGFSRDGYHWTYGGNKPFIGVDDEPGNWRWANVQSAGGGCLIVRDRLYFYFSARTYNPGPTVDPTIAHGTTGLATLRRDGFASMDAGAQVQTLTTVPLQFDGKHLFVNVRCPYGRLTAEWIDTDGQVIEPLRADLCVPTSIDSTCHRIEWQTRDDLSAIRNQPVRLRLHLMNGNLYSFWVSRNPTGESDGYVAAGGPSYNHQQDRI